LTYVSLDDKQIECAKGADYQIWMKCNLDYDSRQSLEPILAKHNLVSKEEARDSFVRVKMFAARFTNVGFNMEKMILK
jgi:hypothetical protein